MVTSELRAEVEIWPLRACEIHPAIIIGFSVIVDLAMGQIPRSIERISSFFIINAYAPIGHSSDLCVCVCDIIGHRLRTAAYLIDVISAFVLC